MAYDPALSEFVLFGGSGSLGVTGDTWTWDGTTTGWTDASSTGPAARVGASMAYDTATSQLVLFGGFTGSTYFNDTWTWDGTAWTKRSLSSPAIPARFGASMAYDTATSQLVLFGGSGNNNTPVDDDTWTWDNTTSAWNVTSSTGAPARYFASMAYDSAASQLVLFGGYTGSSFFGDTWTWDGATWTLASSTGPSVRDGASMADDPGSNQLVLFGGGGGSGYHGDSWTWDGATWTLASSTGPSARAIAVMADNPATSQLVLFGGENNGISLGDTWSFSVPAPVSPGPAPLTTTITQVGPVGGRTTAAAWARFTGHLDTTGQHGWTRYVTTSKGCGVAVSSSGKITTTGRFKGRCTVSGTDSDTGTSVDSGTWSYALTIGAVTISERGPKAATTTMVASAGFTSHFRTNGGRGRVRYVTTSKACGVTVSRAGAIRTRGRLKAGHCTVSGTDTDPGHARGTWSFTLTVRP